MKLIDDGFDDSLFILNLIGKHLHVSWRLRSSILLDLQLLQVPTYGTEGVLKGDAFLYVSMQYGDYWVPIAFRRLSIHEAFEIVAFHHFWVDFSQFLNEWVGPW